MVAERALLMIWDGLRPDFVSEQQTPNLWRLAQQGVWFERSHAVYPTLTRANSPAISTGCRPGLAGVPGNKWYTPPPGVVAGANNSWFLSDTRSVAKLPGDNPPSPTPAPVNITVPDDPGTGPVLASPNPPSPIPSPGLQVCPNPNKIWPNC